MRDKKHILKKLIVFMLLLTTINIGLCVIYYNVYAIKKPYFKTEKRYQKKGKNATTIVLGHSRTVFGIDDNLIAGVFNFATYGENSIYTYYKLKGLIEKSNHKIQRVVIPVCMSSFFSNSRPEMADHSYWNRYLDYNELGKAHNNRIEYFSTYLQSKIVPYRHFVISELDKKSRKTKKVFHSLKTNEEKLDYAQTTINQNFNERNYYDDISYRYLKKLLKLCEKESVEVIAVKFPITSFYKKVFNAKMQENKFNEVKFLNLLDENSVVIWDESDFFKNDLSVFKDVHHLNKKGTKKFSIHFKNKLTKHIEAKKGKSK